MTVIWSAARLKRLAWRLATVVAFAGPAAGAAQDSPGEPARDESSRGAAVSGQPSMVASFGWGGNIPAERWSPITVYVTAGDEPIAGTIVAEFPQDPVQSARIVTPFAATPNRTTPVTIVAAMPMLCDQVTLSMHAENGRLIRRVRHTRFASGLTAQLPPIIDESRGLFVSAGRSSAGEGLKAWGSVIGNRHLSGAGQGSAGGASARSRAPATPLRADDHAWSQAVTASVLADELPPVWTAYEGVTALIVNPEGGLPGRSVDPRAQEAVRSWVRSGGRLVVMADGAGDLWKDWLPEEAREFVVAEPLASAPTPAGIRELLSEASRVASDARRVMADIGGDIVIPEIPAAAGAVNGRVMTVGAAGAAAGWKAMWGWAEEGGGGDGRGLLAGGPVGFGYVMVVGLEPSRAAVTVSSAASGAVWRSVLEPAVADWRDEATEGQARAWSYGYNTRAEAANNIGIERLGDVPMVGDMVFYFIAGSLLLLVAMVGPVDYFVLKRLGVAQRSWLTALFWIAAACGIAYAAPRYLRAAPTQVNRVSVVDRMILPGPGGLPRADSPTYAAALTGIYAGESGVARVKNPDLASWWRGQSTRNAYSPFKESGGVAIVPTVQAAAGGEAGSQRGNPLVAQPMGLWTFRTFCDYSTPRDGAMAGRIGASITRSAEAYDVQVTGLRDGVKVTAAALRIGGRWLTLHTPEEAPEQAQPTPGLIPQPPRRPLDGAIMQRDPIGAAADGACAMSFPSRNSSPDPPKNWSGIVRQQYDPWFYSANAKVDERPGPLLELQGPNRRSQAIGSYLATGRWAVLLLNIEDCPTGLELNWPAKESHTMILRLLVPIEESVSLP